jgi:hypothetical protein
VRFGTAVVLSTICTVLALAQTALTNDSVIKMVKAGLGDDVVVSMVKGQPGGYSTGPDDLIALKSAGVSDKVIAAMVARMSPGAGAWSTLPRASRLPSTSYSGFTTQRMGGNSAPLREASCTFPAAPRAT